MLLDPLTSLSNIHMNVEEHVSEMSELATKPVKNCEDVPVWHAVYRSMGCKHGQEDFHASKTPPCFVCYNEAV